MATGGNTRAVELAIGVSTSGTEAVSKLREAVADLAKQGGAAAPEFEKLVAELDKIGAQQNALDGFVNIRREVVELAAAMDKAAAEVDRLGAELPDASAKSETFRLAQQEAGATVKTTAAALEAARIELQQLREETPKGTRNTDEYRIAAGELKATIATLTAELRNQKTEYRDTASATKEVVTAETALVKSYNDALGAAKALSGELGRQNTALDESRATVTRLGLATTDLVAGQQQIRDAYAQTRTAIESNADATKQLATAQALLDAELEIATRVQRQAAAADIASATAERDRVAAIRATTTAIQEQGRATQTALEAAFATTGVRAASAINAELRKIDDALDLIARDARTTGAQFDAAFNASRTRVEALKAELAGVDTAVKKTAASTDLLGAAVRQAAVYFSAFTFGKEFIEANAQLETLRRTLTIVTGSTESAAQQIEFLRKTANDSGVTISSITGAYSRFAASALASNIPLQTVNRTFGDVTKAAGLLGLSSEEVGGALNALGQIASKGKVSMEELGQQLGDRLPAVLATTARGLNVTTAELTKLITNGEILGDANFFNAFSKGIEESFLKGQGAAQGLNADIARLKNTFNDFFVRLGEAGLVDAVSNGIGLLGPLILSLTNGILGVGKAAGTTIGFIGDLATKLGSLNFKGAGDTVRQFREEIERLNVAYFKQDPGKGPAWLDDFNAKSPEANFKAGLLYQGYLKLTGQTDEMAKSATAATAAQAQLGGATATAATAATAAASQYTAIIAAYGRVIEANEKSIQQSAALAEAKKVEGAASLELARITGNEAEIRKVATQAAADNATALATLATARATEATLIAGKIEALRAEAIAHGGVSDAIKKQLDDLGTLLKTKEAEAEKSRQVADAARTEVIQRGLLTESYKDNSGNLKELTANVQFYIDKLAGLKDAAAAGAKNQAELSETAKQLAFAQGLVKDALSDTVKAIEAQSSAVKSNNDIILAGLNVTKARIQAELEIAKVNGNSFEALQKTIELKRLEIKIAEAKIEATKAEARAIVALAEAERAELQVTDPLNKAKLAAIDASLARAKVLGLEAEAASAGLKVLQAQINNLQIYGTETRKTTTNTNELRTANDSLTGSLKNSGDAASKAGEAVKGYGQAISTVASNAGNLSSSLDRFNASVQSILGRNTDSSGFSTDNAGNRITATTQQTIPEGGSFDQGAFNRASELAARLGQAPPDPARYVRQPSATSGGLGAPPVTTRNANYAAELAAAQARIAAATGGSTSGSAIPNKGGSSQAKTTVNINLEGKTTTIGVDNRSDADKLAGLLGTLTGTKARSSV